VIRKIRERSWNKEVDEEEKSEILLVGPIKSFVLEKNGQMPVLPVLGLHIQGPNGPKAYMGQNIYLLL
jgi:hypothetical protein